MSKFDGGVVVTGLDQVTRKMQEIRRNRAAMINRTAVDIGAIGLKATVDHMPIDEAVLVNSAESAIEKMASGAVAVIIRVPLNSAAKDYAIAMHENQYTPGKKSQKKGEKLGLPVGRKYMTHGIIHAKPRIDALIEERSKL